MNTTLDSTSLLVEEASVIKVGIDHSPPSYPNKRHIQVLKVFPSKMSKIRASLVADQALVKEVLVSN
jgi:hypothetical protein